VALQPRAPGLSQGVRSDLVGRSSSEGWRQALCLSSHPVCGFWLWRCGRGHVGGELAFRNMVLVLFPDRQSNAPSMMWQRHLPARQPMSQRSSEWLW